VPRLQQEVNHRRVSGERRCVPSPTDTHSGGCARNTYLVCPARVRRRAALSSPSSPRACQRQRRTSVSVFVVVLAVPVGEMATVRRDARANGDCRRRQRRLHAAVLAECGGGGATRHRVRICAGRDRRGRRSRAAPPDERETLETRRSGIRSRGHRRLTRDLALLDGFRARARARRLARQRTNGRRGHASRATYRRARDRADMFDCASWFSGSHCD